jgi:hypothetical protein
MKRIPRKAKSTVFSAAFFLTILWLGWAYLSPAEAASPDSAFFQDVFQKVSKQAAGLGFDYYQRPVVKMAVFDFQDATGKEIRFGRDLADFLRLKGGQEKQFFIYGGEDPLVNTLRSYLQKDPQFKTGVQRAFQDSTAFSRSPVDIVITGHILKEEDSRLTVRVNLIPLFKRVSAVEGELNRRNYTSLTFLSPRLTAEEMQQALTVLEKPKRKLSRLIILSHLESAGSQGREKEENFLTGSFPAKGKDFFKKESWQLERVNDLAFWLDEKEIKILKAEDWEDSRKRLYHDVLSGFKAGQIWFDNDLAPGEHSLVVSLPVNGSYKTFIRSFLVREDTTYYLYFSVITNNRKEPVLQVRYIADASNTLLPF